MRTTVVIPDEVVDEVRKLVGNVPLSRFVRESVIERLQRLQRETLAAEMVAGYQAEARRPSLDPEWSTTEAEGL
ncbi:MAG: hypothetical protein GXP48_05110 [Acidobacteria bacterium]|nr:hypothetical protein [Acidobacteriota bacterium]